MPKTFDQRFRVETQKNLLKEDFDPSLPNILSANRYEPTFSERFSEIIRELDPKVKEGRFIDFGCGKGRVLILAAEAGFKSVSGVEFEPSLYASACENVAKTEFTHIDIVNEDASVYRVPDDSTLFYFYNPFNIWLMEKVLENIIDSVIRNPREACIVYVTPVHTELFYPERFVPILKCDKYEKQNYLVYTIKTDEMTSFEKAMMKLRANRKQSTRTC